MAGLLPKHPQDIGFPAKIDGWRPGQEHAVELLVLNNKRFGGFCGPTGFGKSPCYMAQSQMEGGRTCIVVKDKALQDQLMEDWSGTGLVDIRGKKNYKCAEFPEWSCSDGYAGNCSMRHSTLCPYTDAHAKAMQSKKVVTNYTFWIAVHRFGLGLGKFDLVIFDEAQHGPSELSDSMTVSLSHNEMDMLGYSFPHPNISGDDWKKWASTGRAKAYEALKKQKEKVASSPLAKKSWITDLHHYKSIMQKMATVALMRPPDWIWEEGEVGYQFDPIRYGRYAESRLFLKIPRITFASATLTAKTMYMMNVRGDQFSFMDFPSPFDPSRSPIYNIPIMRMGGKGGGGDYSPILHAMDNFMGRRINMGRPGIVNVTSFGFRDMIYNNSAFRRNIVSHFNGDPVSWAIQSFRKKGGALISPSIWSGIDFPDDQCRWQITPKVPFPPAVSKVARARQELDRELGIAQAMQLWVQSTGRHIRSPEDWGESVIFDSNVNDWFMRAANHLAPISFRNRLKFSTVIPQPLMLN